MGAIGLLILLVVSAWQGSAAAEQCNANDPLSELPADRVGTVLLQTKQKKQTRNSAVPDTSDGFYTHDLLSNNNPLDEFSDKHGDNKDIQYKGQAPSGATEETLGAPADKSTEGSGAASKPTGLVTVAAAPAAGGDGWLDTDLPRNDDNPLDDFSAKQKAPAPAEGAKEAPAPAEGAKEAPAPAEGAKEGGKDGGEAAKDAKSAGLVTTNVAAAPKDGGDGGNGGDGDNGFFSQDLPHNDDNPLDDFSSKQKAPAPAEGAKEAPAPAEGAKEAPAPAEGAKEGGKEAKAGM